MSKKGLSLDEKKIKSGSFRCIQAHSRLSIGAEYTTV